MEVKDGKVHYTLDLYPRSSYSFEGILQLDLYYPRFLTLKTTPPKYRG